MKTNSEAFRPYSICELLRLSFGMLAVGILLALRSVACVASDETAESDFERHIRPILAEHCHSCHSADKQEGGLRLDSAAALRKGGDSGPVVVSGEPDSSLLMNVLSYQNEIRMPPKSKLPDSDLERVRSWILRGAVWPADSPDSSSEVLKNNSETFDYSDRQKQWWAFQPPSAATKVPENGGDDSWCRNEIDHFVMVRLKREAMEPALEADRRTWIRRVTFDLTGLPPTPEEVDEFVQNSDPNAFENAADRLLASAEYGKRWARHWLDVVRYADYHDGDPAARDATCEPMQAWRYRNWIVDSFNRDLPWNEFIRHQIAGDLLPSPEGLDFYADGLVATTFLSNGSWDRGDADKEKMVSDMVDDNIDTIGKAFLGLTLGCARCHHHKFDPISHDDYYALAGIFYSSRILKDLGAKGGNYVLHRVPLASRDDTDRRATQLREIAEIDQKLKSLDQESPPRSSADSDRVQLLAKKSELERTLLPEPGFAESVTEGGTPGGLFPGIQDVPIHIRGSYTRLGKVVPRGMPRFFVTSASGRPMARHSMEGSGRRELADWVASADNPLTARVIVNRVWQGHFGVGLVRTPNNFGVTSEPPELPDLLDWLSIQMVKDGWSLKKLHRRIVLSATYRQSSRDVREDAFTQDPDNRWFGRYATRRLEAEAIRDSLLFVAGTLDLSPRGPATHDVTTCCRSLYVQTARWDRSGFAALFDAANPDASEEKRTISTAAPQSLFLMNHPWVRDTAAIVARRVLSEVADQSADLTQRRIQRLFGILFQRSATEAEIRIADELLLSSGSSGPSESAVGTAPSGSGHGVHDRVVEDQSVIAQWTELCHVLLCSNEFVVPD